MLIFRSLQRDGFFSKYQLPIPAISYRISAKTGLRFLSGSRRKIRDCGNPEIICHITENEILKTGFNGKTLPVFMHIPPGDTYGIEHRKTQSSRNVDRKLYFLMRLGCLGQLIATEVVLSRKSGENEVKNSIRPLFKIL
ncbi:MAG: hypothetical protein LBR10_04660 [Prevotellaceae bacterium]|jgi:hypothetical protein|nr:hypothetical protein [Prevotellaceae bacterium]